MKGRTRTDIYLISPGTNKKLKSDVELMKFLEENPSIQCDLGVTSTKMVKHLSLINKNRQNEKLDLISVVPSQNLSVCPQNDQILLLNSLKNDNNASEQKFVKTLDVDNVSGKMKESYSCHICGAHLPYFLQGQLITHFQNKHEGQNPWNCSNCGKTFSTNKTLKRHIASVHEGKKPQRESHNVEKIQNVKNCNLCNKNFSRNEHLKRHITSVHEGKKSEVCSFCDKGFADKSHLKRHIFSKHEGISYSFGMK